MAATWAACGATVLLGVALVVMSPFSGLELPLLGLFMTIPLWLATTSRTQMALALLLLYMGLVDGFLKLQSSGELPTIGRDVLLYALLAGLVLRARRPWKLPPLAGWAVAWTLVIVAQLAHPENGNLVHSAAALRQHLEFVPLLFVGYALLRTHRSLETFFALLLAVAAINGAVGAYQSALTPEQLSGWGPGYAGLLSGETPRTAPVEGEDRDRVRPPGLGSDMGFAGVLAATALPGGIALLLSYRRRRWPLVWTALGTVGAVVGVLTSQSRAAVITALVAVLAMFALLAAGRQARRSVAALCVGAAVIAAAVLAVDSYDSGTLARYGSIAPNQAVSTAHESRAATWAVIPEYMVQIPFGAGIGSVGPAAGIWGDGDVEWNAESQFTFLIVEAGILGLLVLLGFQAALFAAIVTGLRRERDSRTVLLLAAMTAPLFAYGVGWLAGVNTTSTPNAAYLWFAAGVVSYWLVTRQRGAMRPFTHG